MNGVLKLASATEYTTSHRARVVVPKPILVPAITRIERVNVRCINNISNAPLPLFSS